MDNGGTGALLTDRAAQRDFAHEGLGPFRGDLLLSTSGRGPLPPSIVRVNPQAPHNTTVLLDNFFGRQFNSLNDIKVHPTSGAIFFTDSTHVYS